MSKYELGPDIDLDDEVVRDARGRRVTEKRAEQIAARASGRPSLDRGRGNSPQVVVRLNAELDAALRKEAEETGETVSAIARKALAAHVRNRQRRARKSA